MPQTSLAPPVVVYPDTDDLPMPEGGFQFNAVSYAVLALRVHFAHRADVFVAGNMFIYDQEGNPNSSRNYSAHEASRSKGWTWLGAMVYRRRREGRIEWERSSSSRVQI